MPNLDGYGLFSCAADDLGHSEKMPLLIVTPLAFGVCELTATTATTDACGRELYIPNRPRPEYSVCLTSYSGQPSTIMKSFQTIQAKNVSPQVIVRFCCASATIVFSLILTAGSCVAQETDQKSADAIGTKTVDSTKTVDKESVAFEDVGENDQKLESSRLIETIIEQKTDVMLATGNLDLLYRVRRSYQMMPVLDDIIQTEQSRIELAESISKESSVHSIQQDKYSTANLELDQPISTGTTLSHWWAERVQSQWAIDEAQQSQIDGLVRLAAYSTQRKPSSDEQTMFAKRVPPATADLVVSSRRTIRRPVKHPRENSSEDQSKSGVDGSTGNATIVRRKAIVLRANDFVVRSKLDVKPTASIDKAVKVDVPPPVDVAAQSKPQQKSRVPSEPSALLPKKVAKSNATSNSENATNPTDLPAKTSTTISGKEFEILDGVATRDVISEEVMRTLEKLRNHVRTSERNDSTQSQTIIVQQIAQKRPHYVPLLPKPSEVTQNPHFVKSDHGKNGDRSNKLIGQPVTRIPVPKKPASSNEQVGARPAKFRMQDADAGNLPLPTKLSNSANQPPTALPKPHTISDAKEASDLPKPTAQPLPSPEPEPASPTDRPVNVATVDKPISASTGLDAPMKANAAKDSAAPVLVQETHELPMPLAVQAESQKEGQTVTLDVTDSDVRAVLEILAKGHDLNIMIAPKVSGKVTANIDNLSPHQTLEAVLKLCDLTAQYEGNVIYIFPSDQLPKSAAQLRIFTLDFAQGDSLLPTVKELLTEGGNAYVSTIDSRDNHQSQEALMVVDTLDALSRVESFLMQADQPPRQVMIQAHVLEINLGDDNVHGVDLSSILGEDTNVTTGELLHPSSTQNGPMFLAHVDGGRIDSMIDILQTTTDAKTLASPRVMVVNGESARIHVGKHLGFSVANVNGGATVQDVRYLETGIVLEVMPTISRDDQIMVKVKPKVSKGGIDPNTQLPIEDTRELQTSVLLGNHQGIVIGGLIRENDKTVIRKLPVLGDLERVGKFFQRREATRNRSEVVIAIVPHIVEPGCAECFDEVTVCEAPIADQAKLEQATTPLFNGPLNRNYRPWESRLPDVAGKR